MVSKKRAFTLVELLVVIGIIALLVGILLPALNKARRSANTLKCSSNMRQISLALLTYISDNKGKFPIGQVSNSNAYATNGFYWANELVTQKYINSPNMFDASGNLNLSSNSAFFCPEGVFDQASSVVGTAPNYPTDGQNMTYTSFTYNNYPNTGQKFAIATWYMINIRNLATTNVVPTGSLKGGSEVTPFVYYNSDAATNDGDFSNPQWIRYIGLVKHSADMIMLLEAVSNNPCDQAGFSAGHLMRRLAGRHGSKTFDKTNAYTNFAYFDGHVALWPSDRFDNPGKYVPGFVMSSGTTGFTPWHKDTIGYLNNQ